MSTTTATTTTKTYTTHNSFIAFIHERTKFMDRANNANNTLTIGNFLQSFKRNIVNVKKRKKKKSNTQYYLAQYLYLLSMENAKDQLYARMRLTF